MKHLTDAQLNDQLAAARDRGTAEWHQGLRATAVRYDRARRHLVLDLSNGFLLGVPLTVIPALAEAGERQLADVLLSPEGGAIHIPALDVDLSVPGLVLAFARAARGEGED
ncbi:MAG TPA: DUF2442 domain-containing protein [Gemmatimonadaceae bacterium]|nr:DUF2442 domain-containing protein [Gemmatimonadaceae bacterium]